MEGLGTQPEHWDQVAEGFDELVTPINMSAGQAALGFLQLDSGTRLLDVAAGTGALAFPAARSGASVLATDFSPVMVDRLRERAREAGLSNLEARVMDGTALELEDDSFDVSVSQNGVSLFPDIHQGLAEMVRVTRPGGKVLISAFGPMERAGFVTAFIEAVKIAAPELPLPGPEDPPLAFQVADPAEMRRMLEEAGLQDVRVEQITEVTTFGSPQRYWDTLVNSNPIPAGLTGQLSEDQRSVALEAIEETLAERPAEDGCGSVATEMNVGIGTTPEQDA